jgi:putative endonuclease
MSECHHSFFMLHFVYIIQSLKHHRYYCGASADVETRLEKHNAKATTSTRNGVPWVLVRIVECATKQEALQLEIIIKKRGIGRWIAEHPE